MRHDHVKRQELKRRYGELLAIVSGVIVEWDPYALRAEGAPDSEFDDEIARVITRVGDIKSASDAILVISQVFSEAFDPEDFSLEQCQDAGVRLFTELRDHGFVSEN